MSWVALLVEERRVREARQLDDAVGADDDRAVARPLDGDGEGQRDTRDGVVAAERREPADVVGAVRHDREEGYEPGAADVDRPALVGTVVVEHLPVAGERPGRPRGAAGALEADGRALAVRQVARLAVADVGDVGPLGDL